MTTKTKAPGTSNVFHRAANGNTSAYVLYEKEGEGDPDGLPFIVSWRDDARQVYWAWIPAGNVRHVTDSKWDIIEYDRCPPSRRGIRWGDRMPGFLPA